MTGDTTEVLLAVLALVVALGIGWAAGGRFEQLGHLPLRRGWLVVVGVGLQLLGAYGGGRLYGAGLALSATAVAVFLLANRAVQGVALVALGLLSNAVVVLANGAMPVSAHAATRAGVGLQDLLAEADPRHELADSTTALRPLSDVVPVALPVHPEVVSPGDVLVAAGLAQLVVVGMRRRAV